VNGQVKRTHDEDIQSNILEIVGTNVQSTYITCPADPSATLGIKLPFLAMTRVKPFICTMPLKMDDGWNQIQLNLADLTRRAYGTNYVETLRVQVHANCRLRRIYFSDRLYSEEELPPEFKLYLPMQKKVALLLNHLRHCKYYEMLGALSFQPDIAGDLFLVLLK
ncbi:cilia- and flagella-associated protein 20, partial [Tanacetum coccineum]